MRSVKNGKNVTSVDVAELAGVSQATVSRAFSEAGNLTLKMRSRVLKAAKELGYQPNAIARGLVSSRSNLIGVVKGHTENPIFNQMLNDFALKIQDMGKQILYFAAKPGQDIDEVMWNVLKYQVEGIILLYTTLSSALTLSCQQRNIPVLQMLRYSMDAKTNVFVSDNHGAAGKAAAHLVERGFDHFVYITGEPNSSTNMERYTGIVDKLREMGRQAPLVVEGDFTYNSGRAAIRKIAADLHIPCGILCSTDMLAMGAMDALRHDCGLRVPEDAGVVGFDDIAMAGWPSYSLTTIRQPIAEMVEDGLETLCRNMEDITREPVVRKYDCALIKRSST